MHRELVEERSGFPSKWLPEAEVDAARVDGTLAGDLGRGWRADRGLISG